jgi:DnaJ-class molecular chaperone
LLHRCFKLFGLSSGATLEEVKNAYKRLAKNNHPDRFTDAEQKKKQELMMMKINEAYDLIVAGIENSEKKDHSVSARNDGEKTETDYSLYKDGIEIYKKYFDSFFQLFSKRVLRTVGEKVTNLAKAKAIFIRLVREYPESDWISDTKDKLKNIEKALEYLAEAKTDR